MQYDKSCSIEYNIFQWLSIHNCLSIFGVVFFYSFLCSICSNYIVCCWWACLMQLACPLSLQIFFEIAWGWGELIWQSRWWMQHNNQQGQLTHLAGHRKPIQLVWNDVHCSEKCLQKVWNNLFSKTSPIYLLLIWDSSKSFLFPVVISVIIQVFSCWIFVSSLWAFSHLSDMNFWIKEWFKANIPDFTFGRPRFSRLVCGIDWLTIFWCTFLAIYDVSLSMSCIEF